MSQLDILKEHHRLCDEIHQCVLDENRFLRQQQRPPDARMIDRKRDLLSQLDTVLGAMREMPAASARTPEMRDQLERTRARILQIIQLDKENEQLLLRCSLASTRPAGTAAPAQSASAAMLQKIYSRVS